MPTANRFFLGFFPADQSVQDITHWAVGKLGDKLSAVNVYNEAKLLDCKFAWMAVQKPEFLADVQAAFGEEYTSVTEMEVREVCETQKTFKQVTYLHLALARDNGALKLTKPVLDFLLKDLVGGVVIEQAVVKIVNEKKAQPLDALVGVLRSMLPGQTIRSVTVDTEDITEALKYCEVRRKVAVARQEQQKAEQKN
eukprot:TRINITY_DN7963_c0_g1_i1.p1 TRINITY_DN7963_c0_g1~~TRINITY_DN7963_c0_g1_i1.p1  ORF type:complete len:214 (+),score=105.23 TRINITY_DN7963_c0_g1_i1:57-644(+)